MWLKDIIVLLNLDRNIFIIQNNFFTEKILHIVALYIYFYVICLKSKTERTEYIVYIGYMK